MSEIVCLYCKNQCEEKEGICAVCGMPVSLSDPEKTPVPKSPIAKTVPKVNDSREQRVHTRIYIALAICATISLVGFLVQRHFSIDESRPENTRVILDQSVGVAKPAGPGTSDQVNSDYEAAKSAFDAGRLDEAEQKLKKIPETDKDYPKVRRLILEIESERRIRENHKGTKKE